jgi:hypothetical protein
VSAEPSAAGGNDVALPMSFIRLQAGASEPPPPSEPLEVVLSNGRVVRVPASFDSTFLARLIAAVEGGRR